MTEPFPPRAGESRGQWSRAALLFLTLLLTFVYVFPRWADWNQNSRLDMILAVVDRGTLAIDAYVQNTGDYAFYDGHYYSDKAPGTAFAGIPIYWVYRRVVGESLTDAVLPRLASTPAITATLNQNGTGLLRDKVAIVLALSVVSLVVIAAPAALLGVLLYRQLYKFLRAEGCALLVTLAYALATPALAYSNNLYGHQLAALALFAAFYLLYEIADETHGLRVIWRLVGAGALLGIALVTEYPTALIAAGLGVYALLQIRARGMSQAGHASYARLLRAGLALALGALPFLLLLGGYNYAIFSTPLPVAYRYSVLWQETHSVGLISISTPTLDALWGITFSPYRGLFLFAPWLLMAIPGFITFWREKSYRREFGITLWSVTSFLLFNASSAMWSGGFGVGPRYLTPMLPFLAIPVYFLLARTRKRWLTLVFVLLTLVSGIMIWLLAFAGQGFPQFEKNPLVEYAFPRWASGDIARNVGALFGLRGPAGLGPLVVVWSIFGATWWWLGRGERSPSAPREMPVVSMSIQPAREPRAEPRS